MFEVRETGSRGKLYHRGRLRWPGGPLPMPAQADIGMCRGSAYSEGDAPGRISGLHGGGIIVTLA